MTEKEPAEKLDWEVELDRKYEKTLNWVFQLSPKTSAHPDDEINWNQYISYWEERLLRILEYKGRTPSQARKLVQRGWAVLDLEIREYQTCFELDEKETRHAIPTLLENTGEGWYQPVPITLAIYLLPEVQEIRNALPEIHPREEIESLIQRSITVHSNKKWTPENHHARMLAQAAEGLEISMYIPMGEVKDMGWVHAAQQSKSFWKILKAAIEFGKRNQLYEIYDDGKVEESVRNFILSPLGKKGGPWKPVISQAIDELEKKGLPSSPRKVLEFLGGSKNGKSDDRPCSFNNALTRDLPPISWPQFQGKVKRERRKRR